MTIHFGVEWLQGAGAFVLLLLTALSIGLLYNRAQKDLICERRTRAKYLQAASWLGVVLLAFYAALGCFYIAGRVIGWLL